MICVQIIVDHLSGEEVDGLRAMFEIMDTNKNGLLTFEQFKNGLRKLGSQLADHEFRQLMDTVSFINIYLMHCFPPELYYLIY